jgi:hypothetical protein
VNTSKGKCIVTQICGRFQIHYTHNKHNPFYKLNDSCSKGVAKERLLQYFIKRFVFIRSAHFKNQSIIFEIKTASTLLQCALEWYTCLHMRADSLKERFKDPFVFFTSIFISKPLLLLLRHSPIPEQRTKNLVADALVLPCQLLVLPPTIGCDPATRATKRDRPVSDPLLAR